MKSSVEIEYLIPADGHQPGDVELVTWTGALRLLNERKVRLTQIPLTTISATHIGFAPNDKMMRINSTKQEGTNESSTLCGD